MIASPLLNTPHFDQVFCHPLPLDDQGLLRAVEMIALPGTRFTLIKEHPNHIVEVATDAYPSSSALYLDRRFLQEPKQPAMRPDPSSILKRLTSLLGARYIWGGNWSEGIPELLTYYPPPAGSTEEMRALWSLQGVDCSGLLYEASGGYSPRNTSELMHFGKEISLEEIDSLDLIVYKGHVLIALDPSTLIESRLGHGVVSSKLKERISELPPFTIRRWTTA